MWIELDGLHGINNVNATYRFLRRHRVEVQVRIETRFVAESGNQRSGSGNPKAGGGALIGGDVSLETLLVLVRLVLFLTPAAVGERLVGSLSAMAAIWKVSRPSKGCNRKCDSSASAKAKLQQKKGNEQHKIPEPS